jgi:hypothetical protein
VSDDGAIDDDEDEDEDKELPVLASELQSYDHVWNRAIHVWIPPQTRQ